MTERSEDRLICIGVITSAHGIRGAVNIKAYTDNPKDVASYGPVFDSKGKASYKLKVVAVKKDRVVAMIDGLDTRNEAEKLKGMKLYIPRNVLPETLADDEFYIEDLIGLTARLEDGDDFGIITAIHNYGACDILEIQLKNSNREELVAFTKDCVPEVNLNEGYVVVNVPEIEFVGDNDNKAPQQ